MTDSNRPKPETAALHTGEPRYCADNASRARSATTPIYQTTTFWFKSLAEMAEQVNGNNDLHMYTRYSHPNTDVIEQKTAAMENTESAVCFSSGMAAVTTTLLSLCSKGDSIVAFEDIYGGTLRLLTEILPRFGVTTRLVPTGDFAAMEAASDRTTRLAIAETPTNPLVQILDLEQFAGVGKRAGVQTLIDNTFATPINQQPCAFGVDIVLHAATKYLAGHSDVMAGVVCGSKATMDRVRDMARVMGGVLDPHAAFLLERGMRTLGVRMARHNGNALAVAEMLQLHPKVTCVRYPGLPTHPGHAVAARQMKGFGGMLAVDIAGGAAGAERFCCALRLGLIAVSLGGVETLVSPPALTSHAMLTEAQRRGMGIGPGTLRISVGIEDCEDLLADFLQALDAV